MSGNKGNFQAMIRNALHNQQPQHRAVAGTKYSRQLQAANQVSIPKVGLTQEQIARNQNIEAIRNKAKTNFDNRSDKKKGNYNER